MLNTADYARKNPKTPYGSVGNGSSQHLAGALFEQMTGAQMQHVPYRITSQRGLHDHAVVLAVKAQRAAPLRNCLVARRCRTVV